MSAHNPVCRPAIRLTANFGSASRAAAFVLGVSALLPGLAFGDGERLNFVSCPIVRDTSTVPCWLTEHDGELYYMGIQTDVSAPFNPPYLGHEVLVEAEVSDAPRICGGIVLDPIKISVMPELEPACDTRLPADDRYTIDFNPRPPGPSGGRLAFAGPPPADDTPQPPFTPREFLVTYDFDRGVGFRHPGEIMAIAKYAAAIDASRARVFGARGATLLDDGSLLTEAEDIGRRRAEELARLLGGVWRGGDISVDWATEPAAADGVEDWKSRSVRVVVEP